jgi:4-azaleucine resistance transporter AzlC
MSNRWRQALKATLPIGMGYLPAGFAFGVLAVQAGLSLPMTVGMSVLVFAGALQFAAIPLVAGGAGLGTAVLTALLINLRHIFYALPLIRQLPANRLARAYVIAALTDETYSVLTTLAEERRRALALPVSLINQGYWVAGTALGALLGAEAGKWIPDLDFALPCLFTILAIEQYLVRRQWRPVAVGLVGISVARLLAPGHELIAALVIGLALLALLPNGGTGDDRG